MSILEGVYDLGLRLLRAASPALALGSSKLARGVRGRANAARSLEEWARVHRDPERALIWSHAPSVGEGLQARAILEAVLRLRPDTQGAYTFFSPSAVGLAEKMPVHVAGYLPWDVRSDLEDLVGLMRPSVLAFTKTEVWPGLTAAAVARGVPVVLTAGTLPENASRLRPPARRLLSPAFGALDRVFAIAEEDAERFELLGVSPERIVVTGDPGIDSAWERSRAADPEASYLAPFGRVDRPILVAGSTWPADEDVLLPALARLRESSPGLTVVIAPHEPTEGHLVPLETRLSEAGFHPARLGTIEAHGALGEADAVVVDRVGVLAHLYTIATLAYVGGGFHASGLHSVLEPAAAALPTCFGPGYEGSRAAIDLAGMGAARAIEDVDSLVAVLAAWLRDPGLAGEIGGLASGYVARHRGAAMRTAKALADYMPMDDI